MNQPTERGLDPLPLEFLRFVLSDAGQEIVTKDSRMPLSSAVIAEELRRLVRATR